MLFVQEDFDMNPVFEVMQSQPAMWLQLTELLLQQVADILAAG